MTRTWKTAANAVTRILSIIVQSFFALIVTRTLIRTVGSDSNGIISTSNQIITLLSLVEGGFTLASLVKLYEPYGREDYSVLNRYLSLSAKKFRKMGVMYILAGTAAVLIYTPFVRTEAPFSVTAAIMFLSILPSAFTVTFVNSYRLLFQVSQSEYVQYIIQIITNAVMYITEIIVLRTTENIVYARLCVALFQIVNGALIIIAAMKMFSFADFSQDPQGVEITGTKDVFVSRFSSIIYSSASVLFISTFIGTQYTSVYSVYASVLTVISGVMNAILASPRNALGQLFSSGDGERMRALYNEYELISTVFMSVLYSVTFVLMIPFVKLYIGDAVDVNYVDIPLSVLLVLCDAVQMSHIPAGTCLEVSGNFKSIRNIQAVAASIIIVFSLAGALTWGLYGIVAAKILTSLFLMVSEMISVRKNVLKGRIRDIFRINLPSAVLLVVLSASEYFIFSGIDMSIELFVLYGFLLTSFNAIVIIGVNVLFNRRYVISAFRRFRCLIPFLK